MTVALFLDLIMNRTFLRAAGTLVLLVFAASAYLQHDVVRDSAPPAPQDSPADRRQTAAPIAWSPQRDGEWVETAASVYRVLADDNDGSRHQRLLVRDASGHSLLIAHNIDLAPRVPVDVGDALHIRGQFEWTDKGGVIHWTHHDPRRRHAGGYIELDGQRYR